MTKTPYDEPRLYYFYKLVCNDTNVKDFYVGSTANWSDRKTKHKSSVNNKNHHEYNTIKAKTIRANKGWENWSMIEIERGIYIKRMAISHEYEIMAEMNSTMNSQKCFDSHSKCEHGIIKRQCKNCKGSSICEHNKRKTRCKECGGSRTCEHDYTDKRHCPYCSPYLCECGEWTTEGHLKQHYKSKKCRNFHIKEYGQALC